MQLWKIRNRKQQNFGGFEANLDLSFSLPTEVKNQKNIIALGQKQDNCRIGLGLFSLTPVASQCFLLEMERK